MRRAVTFPTETPRATVADLTHILGDASARPVCAPRAEVRLDLRQAMVMPPSSVSVACQPDSCGDTPTASCRSD